LATADARHVIPAPSFSYSGGACAGLIIYLAGAPARRVNYRSVALLRPFLREVGGPCPPCKSITAQSTIQSPERGASSQPRVEFCAAERNPGKTIRHAKRFGMRFCEP
jgi:hypothetical protein